METAIWQEYDGNVQVIGIINTASNNQLTNFVEQNSITFPILFDPGSPGGVQGGDTYDLFYLPNDGSPYPRDFIIDQNGIFQYANNEIDTEWMLYVLDGLLSNNIVLGDINYDGLINIVDVIMIVNIIIGELLPTEYQSSASELNGDGEINVVDVIVIVNLILGE
ncbi:MAG: redoxin domain-containing protein [Candidatus Marinimicrobia bacterium]|nr:redoxin domain-containing protein [Candidatus Neomarinimicrobiota bacterium]